MGKASRARRARLLDQPRTLGVSVSPEPVRPSRPVLADLRSAAARARKAEDQVSQLVAAARRAGHSWDVIAAAAGRNRETLRRTYGSPRNERDP